MAYIVSTNTTRSESGLAVMLHNLVVRFNAWRSYRETVRALSNLTDAELNDIGLGRGEIERAARQSR